MLRHWLSVTMLLLPVMTSGWLLIGLFVWLLIPGLNFCSSLLVSACITATDPILAQSVVSGKFAQRVPGHLRNLLSAESGCNDGMAFPFIYLSLDLVLHRRHASTVAKDWICVTLLYECLFGCILGAVIGYLGRRAIKYAEDKNIIDRESFLAYYIVLAFCCAGFGSILGVDDLLVSFAAGAAFAWDGWFSKKTKESKVSTVIDLLLNYAYFIYFGAIVPWSSFNDPQIGCDVWRLIILALIVILLRRIPAVLILKRWIPDIKSWREALFVGHFGPIGVGAVFAAILSRGELEMHARHTEEPTPLKEFPPRDTEHWQIISCIWPIVCFLIVTSIIVHGSSVAMITLGKHLNTITLSRSFSTATTNGGKSSWIQRLPSLEGVGRSFSLQRVDTGYSSSNNNNNNNNNIEERDSKSELVSRTSTIETSGVPFRHAGGMRKRPQGVQTASEAAAEENSKRRKVRRRKRRNKLLNSTMDLFRVAGGSRSPYRMGDMEESGFADDEIGGGMHELNNLGRERLQREREARATTFALGSTRRHRPEYVADEEAEEEEEEKGVATGVAVVDSELKKKQLPRVYVQTVNDEEEEVGEEEEEGSSESGEESSDTSTVSSTTSTRSVRSEGGVPSDVYRLKSPVVEELNNYPFAESELEGEEEESNEFVQPDNSNYDLEKQLPQRPLKRRFKERQYSDSMGKSKRRELLNQESDGRGRYHDDDSHGKVAYIDGDQLLVENDLGEIVSIANFDRQPQDEEAQAGLNSEVSNNNNNKMADHKAEGIRKTESNATVPSLEAVKHVVSPKILSKVQSLVSSVVSITPGLTSDEPSEHTHTQHQEPDTYQSEKYHAYRLGNVLIIENDEGDIIRRYRINKHPETGTSTSSATTKLAEEANQRERGHATEGIILKALGMLRLRNDPTNANTTITTATTTTTVTNAENNDNETVQIEKRPFTLTKETHETGASPNVNEGGSGSGSGSNLAVKEGEYTSEEYGLEDLANDRVEDTEDSYEEETEVERMRRLRALGQADDGLVEKEGENFGNKDDDLTPRDESTSSDMSDGGVEMGDNAKPVGKKLRDSIKRRFW